MCLPGEHMEHGCVCVCIHEDCKSSISLGNAGEHQIVKIHLPSDAGIFHFQGIILAHDAKYFFFHLFILQLSNELLLPSRVLKKEQ